MHGLKYFYIILVRMLKGKKIIIGITGGIAAYKIVNLIRLLIKSEAEVQVIMTPEAHKFIGVLTLSTLSKRPVYTAFYKEEEGLWVNHVELGLWADLFIIAPCTANTLAKCANGISDNLLVATYLSARCPVVFAPAMDLDMYSHPSTTKNLAILKSFGNTIIDAEEGELASGLLGKGRMAEPETIYDAIECILNFNPVLKNKKVLITSGPTQESMDPVRFISNHSTGKMGFEIAKAFQRAGAEVYYVSGPTNIPESKFFITKNVSSAEEMLHAVEKEFSSSDIVIFVAAVADFKPKKFIEKKIKKDSEEFELELEKTKDIALEMSKIKQNQFTVGFALETDNELENAKNKLKKKKFDLLILNSLQDKGAGFRYDTNKISILSKNGNVQNFELKSKSEVANDILKTILKELKN